jgi:hypothetical protein
VNITALRGLIFAEGLSDLLDVSRVKRRYFGRSNYFFFSQKYQKVFKNNYRILFEASFVPLEIVMQRTNLKR